MIFLAKMSIRRCTWKNVTKVCVEPDFFLIYKIFLEFPLISVKFAIKTFSQYCMEGVFHHIKRSSCFLVAERKRIIVILTPKVNTFAVRYIPLRDMYCVLSELLE